MMRERDNSGGRFFADYDEETGHWGVLDILLDAFTPTTSSNDQYSAEKLAQLLNESLPTGPQDTVCYGCDW